jgi:hypothetical protein
MATYSYTGSEVYIKAGSVQTYTPLGSTFVLGSVYSTGSINIATTLLPVSGNVLVSGTIGIQNPSTIGSYTGMANGSVWFGGGVGSIMISGTSIPTWRGVGSVYLTGGPTPVNVYISSGNEMIVQVDGTVAVSGTNFSNIIGSVRSQCIQITDPWQIAGSIWSMPSVSATAGSEQWIKGGSIQTYTPLGVGSVMISGTLPLWLGVGSVEINNPSRIGSFTGMSNGSIFWGGGVGSMMISGNVQIIGSVAITNIGSVIVSNLVYIQPSGTFSTGSINFMSGTFASASHWIVSGVTGVGIAVYAYKVVCSGVAGFKWMNGSIDLEGLQYYASFGGVAESVMPPAYLFKTSTGSPLNVTTTGSIAGRVSYFLI